MVAALAARKQDQEEKALPRPPNSPGRKCVLAGGEFEVWIHAGRNIRSSIESERNRALVVISSPSGQRRGERV